MHLGESRARNQSSGQDLASRWDLAMRGAREEEQRAKETEREEQKREVSQWTKRAHG